LKAVTITPNHGDTRFHFIGGKGGVGKTTCAAALGVAAARRGLRVLVASTDPAPSLGDAFEVRLAGSPRRIPLPKGRLSAVEINAASSLKRWLDDRRSTLEAIAVEGTWLDREDIARLLQLSLPGIDELAALLEISRLAGSKRFDLIVVDTAPTGHTLRMLAMPQTLVGVAVVFDRMREKHRVMEEALRGAWRPGAEDALVAELVETARTLAGLVRDPVRARVSWVTLPEPMATAETTDAVRALESSDIKVAAIIVNRLTPRPPAACSHCDARRTFEAASVARLPKTGEVLMVEALDAEPRGPRLLGKVAAQLGGAGVALARPRTVRRWRARSDGVRIGPVDILEPSFRLVLVGGKGGVGKTTTAGALALAAATRRPDRRVLLISTDPAHSLADLFGVELSDLARRLPDGPENLWVRELDASGVINRIRGRYLAAIDQVFDRLGGGGNFDATQDRSVMQSLIDLAPPGLDELAAILEITEAITGDAREWDLVVMDTAPTGHALRLLEMPGLMQDWVRALMSILLKYQGVARLGDLGALLLNLSKGLGRLRDLLADSRQTAFVAVTRPAALPRLETMRLVRRLKRLNIAVAAVVVASVGRGGCKRCLSAARAQQREILATRRAAHAITVPALVLTDARVPPPLGVSGLEDWARTGWHRSS